MTLRKFTWLVDAFIRRHRIASIAIVAGIVGLAFVVKSVGIMAMSDRFLSVVSEKKLTEGLVGAPQTLNPLFVSSDTEKDLSKLLFRGLTQTDFNGHVTGDLAESWEVSADQTYLFHLKPNQHFSDGTRITADDVAATYLAAKNPDTGSIYSEILKGLDVQVISDTDIIFRLPDPFAPFLSLTNLGILPKKTLDRISPHDLRLANLDWGKIASTNVKLLSLDETQAKFKDGDSQLNFRFYLNQADLTTALKLGEITAAGLTNQDNLNAWPSLQRLSSPLYRRVVGIYYNVRSDPLNNRELRYGLSYAIDKGKLAALGNGEKAVGPIPPVSWAVSTNFRHFDIDPASAKSFLDQSGWTGGPVRQRAGKSLEISLSYPENATFQTIAEEIAKEWAAVGVRALLNPLSPSDFKSQVLDSKHFEAALFTEELGVDPDQYAFWHSLHADNTNITGLKVPKVDKSLEDGRQATDDGARKADYASFQRYLMEEAPVTYLYYPKFTYYVTDKVTGINLHALGNPSDRLDNLADWQIGRTLF